MEGLIHGRGYFRILRYVYLSFVLCGVNSLRASSHALGGYREKYSLQRGRNSEGRATKDETPFHRLLFTAVRSLVQMESLLAGFGVKPMLNTKLN